MGAIFFIFQAIIAAYLGLMFFFILIGFKMSKTGRSGAKKAFWIIAIFIAPLVYIHVEEKWSHFQYEKKALPARALFATRCATAKERVYKTANDVEGILLQRIRRRGGYDFDNLYWADAALPKEYSGRQYIGSFLYEKERRNSSFSNSRFFYVDIKEGDRFMRYRLKDAESRNDFLEKESSPSEIARYAVSFVNHMNANDREHGIAGTTVIIKDTWTEEIMAEKTWYSFAEYLAAKGKGKGAGGWDYAKTCPETHAYHSTRTFVEQVLQPPKEQSSVQPNTQSNHNLPQIRPSANGGRGASSYATSGI